MPERTSAAVPFFKLSGAGNDFIALVEPTDLPDADTVRRWCRRGLSIGADGVMALHRRQGKVHLEHWNADGTLADLCLNGCRSAVRLASHLGWHHVVGPRRALEIEIVARAGSLLGRPISSVRSELTLPWSLDPGKALTLSTAEGTFSGHHLVVGVPHLVLFIEQDPQTFELERLGPLLRHHERLAPAGANVNVARVRDEGSLEIRTWERGVEGETLACGTGAIATVKVGHQLGYLSPEVTVLTAGGFELSVGLEPDLRLGGDTRIVASGEIWLDSA